MREGPRLPVTNAVVGTSTFPKSLKVFGAALVLNSCWIPVGSVLRDPSLYVVHTGYIRIHDQGSISRAHGMDCRQTPEPLPKHFTKALQRFGDEPTVEIASCMVPRLRDGGSF